MSSDPEPPIYTPLPLPDPNSSEYAEATAAPRSRRVWRKLALFLVPVLLFATLGGLVARHYWLKTADLDIAIVAFSQKGSIVSDRDGDSMGRLFALDRLPIQIGDLPGHFIDALAATEDNRFFEHVGFDPVGIARAAVANARAGDIREGGSTITQQLARQCYPLGGKTFDRKLTEIAVAMRIEQNYTKHEILEHYLNRIYFGSGFWGIGSAARGYFGKHVGDLDIAESALLCAIIKSPSSYSPFVNPDIAQRQRDRSLHRMADLGLLEAATAEHETAKPLVLADREADLGERPRFLLSRIQKEVRAIAREHGLPLDGLAIETSVDSHLQRAARGHLELGLNQVETNADFEHTTLADHRLLHSSGQSTSRNSATATPPYLQGAVVIVHNGSGEILAAVGGRDFTDSEFDRAFDARRAPGTAFLPLVYASAFDQPDIDFDTELTDAPMDNRQVMIGGTEGVLGEWGRESFVARYEGQISAGLALLDSRGAASVELGQMVGLQKIHDTALRAGIHSPLRDYPSTFLGQSELSLAELAQAYTQFPNLGSAVPELRLVTRIYGPDGKMLYQAAPKPELTPVVSDLTAARISAILRAGLYIGSTRGAYQTLGLKDPSVAGKGGTTHGFTDGWFVGYNKVVTCAVWVGFDSPQEIHRRAFSRNIAMPIWVDLMNALPQSPLTEPADCTSHKICLRTGLSATADCVENFADGKPHSTAVSLPFPGGTPAPPPCAHHGQHRQRESLVSTAHNDRSGSDNKEKKTGTGTATESEFQEPKVIRSHSPLVIGPDPYSQ